jgi:urease accessory protein
LTVSTPSLLANATGPDGGGPALLLLLTDGRLPAGGHAHSGGVEAAVAAGHIAGLADLESWIEGRLATSGRVDAAVAVASWYRLRWRPPVASSPLLAAADPPPPLAAAALAELEAEASARMASPAQRAASRAQGRGLLRVARRCWSAPALDALGRVHADGPLAPMALGGVGAVGGLTALQVATASLWAAASGPAWAAVRLLGLDPLEVTAALARRAPALDGEAARTAVAWGHTERSLAELPAAGAPLAEIGAEAHAGWEARLFAS